MWKNCLNDLFFLRHLYANATEMPPVIGDLPCKYPFVLHAPSLPYTLCYIQQLAGVVPGAIASWAADSMFCSFLYYLAGHFQILITYIKSDADENTKEIDHNAKIVNHHRFLLRYAELSHCLQFHVLIGCIFQLLHGNTKSFCTDHGPANAAGIRYYWTSYGSAIGGE